jgi:hypothetical protein
MLIFMSGTCLVSRLGFSVLAPPAWSPDASFPDPDVCAVRPTGGRVLDVPLAAEQGPRRPRRPEGRECPRGDAPLFTTLRRSAAGSAPCTSKICVRSTPQAAHLRSGRAGVPGPVFVCVFQNGWFRAPSRSYLLYRKIPGTSRCLFTGLSLRERAPTHSTSRWLASSQPHRDAPHRHGLGHCARVAVAKRVASARLSMFCSLRNRRVDEALFASAAPGVQ